jgi:hypothetical protein
MRLGSREAFGVVRLERRFALRLSLPQLWKIRFNQAGFSATLLA